jgi:hypothetical protein
MDTLTVVLADEQAVVLYLVCSMIAFTCGVFLAMNGGR